jgi:hypothetical protein
MTRRDPAGTVKSPRPMARHFVLWYGRCGIGERQE